MFGFMSFLLTVYKMRIQLMTMMFQARNAHSDDLLTPKKKKKSKKKTTEKHSTLEMFFPGKLFLREIKNLFQLRNPPPSINLNES